MENCISFFATKTKGAIKKIIFFKANNVLPDPLNIPSKIDLTSTKSRGIESRFTNRDSNVISMRLNLTQLKFNNLFGEHILASWLPGYLATWLVGYLARQTLYH